MWRSRQKHPIPDRQGIYVVARFVDDEMVAWSNNYAFFEGGWMPNTGGQEYIVFTHWMPYSEYRRIMETHEREGNG